MYPERAFEEVSARAVDGWVKEGAQWWSMEEVKDEVRAMWVCKKCNVEYRARVQSVARKA